MKTRPLQRERVNCDLSLCLKRGFSGLPLLCELRGPHCVHCIVYLVGSEVTGKTCLLHLYSYNIHVLLHHARYCLAITADYCNNWGINCGANLKHGDTEIIACIAPSACLYFNGKSCVMLLYVYLD